MTPPMIPIDETKISRPLSDWVKKQLDVSAAPTGQAVPSVDAPIPAAAPVTGQRRELPDGGAILPMSPRTRQLLAIDPVIVGGMDARGAMWPEQSAPNEVDRPNVFMRGVRGIANGIAQMIPASMTLAGGIIDFMGADEAGQGLAEKGIDLQTWLNEHVAVENPTFYDHFMTGVGSLASFLVPGMGAAGLAGKVGQAAGLAGKAAKTFQALTGGGLMSFLEAGVEQSQRQQELMGQGMTAQQALDASQPVFWHNVGLLMATNIAEFWLPMPASVKNKAIARIGAAVKNAFVEGGQERAQGVIQDVVAGRGEWADFFDPAKYQTETAVGALTGGLAGAVLPGDEADPAQPPATPPASGQKPATGPAAPIPPGGPTAVAAPPPSPPAPQPAATPPTRPVAPAAVPEGMEPPPDSFVPYDEDEEAARGPQAPPPEEPPLVRTPAEMEIPPEAPSAPAAKPAPQYPAGTRPGTSGERVRDVPLPDGKIIEVDASIADVVGDLNNAGYRTSASMSGVEQDYQGTPAETRYSNDGYLAFPKEGMALGQDAEIRSAAAEAGLVTSDREVYLAPSLNVRSGITNGGRSRTDVLHEAWKSTMLKMGITEDEYNRADAGEQTENLKGRRRSVVDTNETVGPVFKDRAKDEEWMRLRTQEQQRIADEDGGWIDNAEAMRRWEKFRDLLTKKKAAQGPAPAPKPKRETAKERRAREQAELDEVNAEARRRMEAAGRPVEDEPAVAPEVLDKNAVVDERYADPEAEADVRRLEREVEDNKRKLADIRAGKLPHLDIGEAERALKGSGMRLAAARRRLTGALTDTEKAAENKRRASNYVGKPVTVNTTTGAVDGVIDAPPAFGKVRVRLAGGKVISAAPGNVTARAVAPPQPEAAPHGRWTVHMVNIADITERPEDMQNRDAAASQKTIDAIRDNYNEIDMEPIKLWRDPSSGDLVTIQGHSRTEGFRQRGETKIPAFIIEGASFEEARRAALEGNFKGDQGSVLDKVKGLRMQAEADGLTPAEIADKAKDLHGKNAPTIIAMMHLNPNGRVIEAVRSMLGAEEVGDSGSSLTKIAKWIGEARRRNQNLTDAHEGEMFDVLRDEMAKKVKKPWASREVDFQKHVRGLATAGGFDASKPLNLGLDKRTPAEKKFDADLAAAQEAVDKAQAAHDEKAAELAAKGIAADVQDQILKKYRADIVIAKTELSVIDGSRERYLQAERDQGGLFRVSGQKPDYRSLAKAAADSGLTPPIKASPRDLVDQMAIRVAKMFGIANVEFVTGLKSKDGQMAHGYYQPQTNTVFLNIESPEPMLTILMHEVGHRMQVQHPDLWAELQQLLASRQTERGKNVYTSNAVAVRGYRPSDVENEWVADGLMEAATSPLFWAEVKQRNPHLAGKLIDMIVDALRAIRKMFARSGASVDVYYDNFGAIIQQVGKVAAEMVAREDAKQLLSRETTDQLEMFKRGPASSSEMEELNKKLDAAYKRAGTRRHTSTWSGFGRHLYYLLMDKNTYLYKAVSNTMKAAGRTVDFARNPYTAIQHFNKWISGAEVAVKYEIRSFDGKTVLSEGLEPIIRRFKLADAIDSGEFGHFWKAATLVSRRWKIGDSFFGDDPTSDIYQERAAAYQKWQDLYDKYSKSHPNWVKAVDALTTFAYARVERAFQAGIIDVDQRDYLTKTYSVYAPLMRLNDEAYNIDRGDVTGAGTLAHEMKVFDHTAEYMDPVDAIIKQTYHMEYFLRSNEARIKLADFIRSYRDNPKGVVSAKGIGYRVKPKSDPVFIKIRDLLSASGLKAKEIEQIEADYYSGKGRTAGSRVLADVEAAAKIYVTATFQEDGVVALMRNGEIEYWKLEPDIYDVYASTQGKGQHDLMKFFSIQTSLLRAGAVLTPDFMARNQFRDFMSSAVIAQQMVRNPLDAVVLPLRIMRGLGHAIKKDATFIEFMLEAGHAELVAQDQKSLPKAVRELTASSKGKASKAKYMLHGHPLTLLQEWSKLTENSTRIAVYEKTKADMLGKGMSEAEARVRAAIQARESSIDFSRSGKYGEVINRIIPFFNAAVQGNDKMVRTMLTDPSGKKEAWARGVMLLTIPSVMLWVLNHDEDWYDDQPQWLKNNFWLFSFDGGKTIHKLPKPFEVGLIYSSLAERVLDWQVKKDPEAMKEWSRAMGANLFAVNAKNPIASSGALLGPMIGSATETVTNYDAYRGSPIVKGWLEEVAPREQYNASTSEFAKLMGGIAPGSGLSPMMIDHFIRGSFGGIGAYATEIASNIIMFADSDIRQAKPSSRLIYDAVPDWMPVVKSVTQTTPMGYTRQISEFYEIYDETREAVKTMQAFKSAGAPREKFEALYRRAGVQLSMSKPVMATSEALGAISKQMRMIESAPATVMSRDEKRKKLDELAANRNQIVDGFMKQYRAVDTKQIQREIDASLDALGRQYEGMRR